MTGPRSSYVQAAGFEVHVTEWGERGRPAIVMWHGLARTGRDFDEAAQALSDSHFVICPDTIGRGLSAWARPEDYSYAVSATPRWRCSTTTASAGSAGSARRWAA